MYNPSAIEKSHSQPQAFVALSDICVLRVLHNLIIFPEDYLQKVYPSFFFFFYKLREMEASHSSCNNF
jgi:hypothetical protein